ncbi:IS66-like element accessory protein TnpA [Acidiphilium sp.]|uniref:IS66-like element accessory protein TnpA n=1 Tax=Acidiphilium sp. TaxID=527 RepID=UPI002BD1BFD5|nr:transposase [Acidiphilium sp.]HQT62840.1 transposase [Acidiphilium sp.]
MEIITGVERRRRWRDEDKLRIVSEAEAPGAVFAEVARRHDISRGQLWSWRRLVRTGELGLVSTPAEFLPVHVAPEPSAAVMIAGAEDTDPASVVTPRSQGRIEVRLAGGAHVVIEGMVAPAVISATLKALG